MKPVRLLSRVFVLGSILSLVPQLALPAETLSYSYDNMARLTDVRYGDGTTVQYVYDNLGNRLQKATTLDGAPANNPPGQATIPSPVDGAVDMDFNPILSWTAATDSDTGDEITYYLHLGTTIDPPLVKSGWETNFIPNKLRSQTTHYWKVVARDSHNAEVTSNLWSFTTKNIPPVAAISADITEAFVPFDVQLTDLSTDEDDAIVSHEWDVDNDGVIDSTGTQISLSFTQAGTYPITLIVTDAWGDSNSTTATIVGS